MKITSIINLGVLVLTIGFFTNDAFARKFYWDNRTNGGFSCYDGIGGEDLLPDGCQGSAAACTACGSGIWINNSGLTYKDTIKSKLESAEIPPSNRPVVCQKADVDGVICVKCDDGSAPVCDFKSVKK